MFGFSARKKQEDRVMEIMVKDFLRSSKDQLKEVRRSGNLYLLSDERYAVADVVNGTISNFTDYSGKRYPFVEGIHVTIHKALNLDHTRFGLAALSLKMRALLKVPWALEPFLTIDSKLNPGQIYTISGKGPESKYLK